MAESVFVVYDYTPYEPNRNVRAFATEAEAQAFVDALRRYLESAPKVDHDLGNTDAEIEKWSKQDARLRRYLKKCPFDSEAMIGNDYQIETVPFGPITQEKAHG